jgi:hypothetical protein
LSITAVKPSGAAPQIMEVLVFSYKKDFEVIIYQSIIIPPFDPG